MTESAAVTAGKRCAGGRRAAVLAGAIAQRPGVAGHAWVFVNWVIGMRQAGLDVVLVDRVDAAMLDELARDGVAARRLAHEVFDARRVVGRVLDGLGVAA